MALDQLIHADRGACNLPSDEEVAGSNPVTPTSYAQRAWCGDVELDVQRLLDELCTKLGFCLPPDEQRRLLESSPREVDGFTDAVFRAEGMGDVHDPRLRRQVRDIVDQHMSRSRKVDRQWPAG
jgi:hypothetical protein